MRLITLLLLAASAHAQIEPQAGGWKTWVLSSGSQLRLPPPPDASTELPALRSAMASADATALASIAYWDAGSPAYRWIAAASDQLVTRNIGGPASTRALALVSVALYDSMVAAWDSKYTYNRPRPNAVDPSLQPLVSTLNSPSYPSEHAVAAGAAAAVLSFLYPDAAAGFASMAQEAAQSRVIAGASFPSDVQAGLDLGAQVGAAVIQWAKTDGSDAPVNGTYPPAPGKWSGTNAVAPGAGQWKPWALHSASDLRPGPPPGFDTSEGAAQLAAVRNLVRTADMNHTVWFWQPSFTTPWLDLLSRKIFEYRLDTNAPRAARAYAIAMAAQHDAILACWDAKYVYLEQRPIQADPTILTAYATPNHPGYPSGHACAGGALGAAAGYLFPADPQDFAAMGINAGMSTFFAQIHTPLDVTTGLDLGAAAAQQVVARARQDGADGQ